MSQSSIRNLVISLAIFVLVVGLAVFTFVNLLKNSQALEKQIAVVAAQNQQEEAMIRLQKLAQSSETKRAQLADHFIFRESDTINFLNEIEDNLAPSLGVELETDDLMQRSQDGKDWVEVSFRATGRRENLQNFIETLEMNPFASRISTIDMSGDQDRVWRAVIKIQVQVLKYDQ